MQLEPFNRSIRFFLLYLHVTHFLFFLQNVLNSECAVHLAVNTSIKTIAGLFIPFKLIELTMNLHTVACSLTCGPKHLPSFYSILITSCVFLSSWWKDRKVTGLLFAQGCYCNLSITPYPLANWILFHSFLPHRLLHSYLTTQSPSSCQPICPQAPSQTLTTVSFSQAYKHTMEPILLSLIPIWPACFWFSASSVSPFTILHYSWFFLQSNLHLIRLSWGQPPPGAMWG